MRPVQLELTNFGPYRKEVINFTQFDHAPLFLIGGDTGAGKSTLFDAMTVALFATTSGDRNVEEMRSTFAGPEDDLTKVTFYFQQGNHLYRIDRERGRRRHREEAPHQGGQGRPQRPVPLRQRAEMEEVHLQGVPLLSNFKRHPLRWAVV